MPDFMIQHVRTCKQNIFFTTKIRGSKGKTYEVTFCEGTRGPYQYGWRCECADFVYRKNDNCKHIQQAKEKKCCWGEDAFMGNNTEANPDGSCPECGGETQVIRVAV